MICLKNKLHLSVSILMAATMSAIMSMSAYASEPGTIDLHMVKMPKANLNVRPGLWQGVANIYINGKKIKHELSFCIKKPSNIIIDETHAKKNNGYLSPSCKAYINDNYSGYLRFSYGCVPLSEITKAVGFSSLRQLKTLPQYDYSYLSLKYSDGLLYGSFISSQSVLIKKTTSKKSEKMKTTRRLSGVLTHISDACPAPVRVPTNKELREEGKHVPSSAELNRTLKRGSSSTAP
jgi:hypothetical protein